MSENNLPIPSGEIHPATAAEKPFGLTSVDELAFGGAPVRYWTTMPRETRSDKALVLKALQGQDVKAAELIGKPIRVANVLAHPVTLVDEVSGEATDCLRVVFIADDGTCVATVSEGVRKGLACVIAEFGYPPYDPPLVVVIDQKPGKGSHRYYTVNVVGEGDGGKGKVKK